jgi:ADP-ribose pyrophosphatase
MELLGSEKVYEGHSADVSVRRYRRLDGTEVERQVVEHPGSVAIVAHDADYVYLVAQPREAVEHDRLLEIPAGTLDHAGESRLECAQRELGEEARLAAGEWTELQRIYPSPGILNEEVTIFLATGLSAAGGERDADEEIEIVPLALGGIGSALHGIRDAATVIGLMLLRDRLDGSAPASSR